MGEYVDKTEGKVKEIYGRATGDRAKQVEGRAQQARGGLKGMLEDLKQAVSRALRNAQDRAHRAT